MASFFSDFGLLWYLEELNKKEFVTFKEFLRQEILQLELKQISWRELKKASREDLGNLLLKHYEEKQTWDITLKIFEKLNRKDLAERAEREMADVVESSPLVLTDLGHPKLYRDHLKTKFADDGFRPFRISIQDFMKKRLSQDDQDYLENLLLSEGDEMKSQMVLVGGVAGIGKTLLLKKFLLAWSESLVIQSKFSYIFYFCCRDVKQLKTASLAELISREWPTPSAPIEEIVSQPEKLLFIIDSLEVMECDLFEQELELCDNCMETQPINILMSSLLRRKILPQSSLLICATLETFEKIKDVIECTNVNIIKGFRESDINKFFHTIFQDKDRAQELFSVVRENEQLFTVCQVPVLCWMVITCLKNEIAKGRDPVSICRRTTSLYTTYIFDLFIPPSAQYPSKKGQNLLLSLCSLAAEGMWTDTFVFGEEALSRNGIMDSDIPIFLDIGLLGKIRESAKVYIFPHPSVQEVCAALYYLLKSPKDHPSQGGVQSIETLMVTFLTKVKVQWVFFGCFIFGLLQKSEQEKLEMFFGYQLSQKIKDELYQFLETIRGNMELQEEIDGMKWFSCLFEFEDEAFQVQALSCMEQIQFVAKDYSDVIIAAHCIKHCSTLKKLSFSTQNVLIEEREESYMEKFLAYWKDICSVFVRNKDIQVLQMMETDFNEPIFQVLYDSLKSPRFTLKGLMANNVTFFGGDQMFFDLIQNCSLEYLNLSRSFFSHSKLETLCDILIQAECHVEKLV
ncbi:NACHT, LRR and PYD domains-containing protein 4A-like [Apodemus sylvaticus]|uniref:NACHT, LRR and PYD domains-containing protein 4A-like n=1 Tax=Apodemus sylvaticus TaxID=10129 RepID=UPI002241CD86|nr:NACHT, LRR and PYD domains-containing protein 4A-like [Apodemus sylvaticus]